MQLGNRGPLARQREQRREKPQPAPVVPAAAEGPAAASLGPLAEFISNSVQATAPGQMEKPNGAGNVVVAPPLPSASTMTGGWVFEITGALSGSVGVQTLTAEVYVSRNGIPVATGIKLSITGLTITATAGRYGLQPGDIVTVQLAKTGALNAETLSVQVWGRLESRQQGAMA